MTDATQPGAEADALIDAKLNKIAGLEPETQKPEDRPTDEAAPEATEGGEQEPSQELDAGAGEEAEGPQLELSNIAAALDVEESALDVTEEGVVIFRAKVDGQDLSAKATDILKGYQLEGAANKRLQEAAEQRKALEQHRQQLEQFAAQRVQQLDDTLRVAHGLLMQEYASVPWEQLKVHDPNAYTLKRQEFADRKQQLDQMMLALDAERQEKARQQQAEVAQRQQQEAQKLLDAIPDWKDPAKRDAGFKEILAGAKEFYGYEQQEVGNAMDHRLFLMARDAIAYRNLQKAKPAVAKKLRIAPKVAAPGQPKAPAAKEAQIKALRERVKKSGGTEGVEELLRLTGRA